MALAKSSMAVRFGKLDQKRAQKSAILGTLDQAINVRQRELGRFSKRYGYSVINRTTDTGTISDAIALANNNGAALLQTSSAVYLRDVDQTTWRHKGSYVAVQPGAVNVAFARKGSCPSVVIASGLAYEFVHNSIAAGSSGSLGTNCYRVVDVSTGTEVMPLTNVSAPGTWGTYTGKSVVAGGFVFFVFLEYNNPNQVVRIAKFDPSTPTVAPALATAVTWDSNTSENIHNIDVFLPSGGSHPAVFLSGENASTSPGNAFYIDTATGGVKASPGLVISSLATAYSCWLRGSGGDGSLWAAGYLATGTKIKLFQINETTLAQTAATDLLATGAVATGNICGYKTGSTKVVFHSDPTVSVESSVVTRYAYDGALTSAVFCRAGYIVSDPFQVSSSWYVVTGHDDGDAVNLQRAYYLRDASATTYANIQSRALYGTGGNMGMRGILARPFVSGGSVSSFVTPAVVDGSTVYVLANSAVDASAYDSYLLTWTFAPSGLQPGNINESQTVFPGGWSRLVSSGATLVEFGMPMFPRAVTVSLLSGTGTMTDGSYSATAVYARADSRGGIMRSAPATAGSTSTSGGNDGVRVVVPTLRTVNSNTDVVLEVYLTAPGGSIPFLVRSVANDPTVDSVTVDITTDPAFGEALYTGGGVLSNYPTPPFRGSFAWNNRLWLFGTEYESESWHSKEFATGIVPEFAPPLKVTTYGGSGSLLAGGVINSDYAALFKRDAVFAITGQGPDDTGGGGAFQVRRVSWDGGCTNHASVVNYPGGLLFQGLDGVIYRLNSGLAVEDIGAEAQDYAAGTVTKAIHLPKDREVRFYLSTGTILVLDYGGANENAPNGYWYLDDSDTFGAATGAIVVSDLAQFVDSTGVVWVEAENQFYDGSSTAILQKLDLNTLQPFDLGGEGRISAVQFVGQWVSTHDLRVSIAVDGGAAVNYDRLAIAANPEDAYVRPGGCGRVSALDIVIEERGTGTGAGFYFDGVQIEMQARGRGKRVNSTQRI